MTDVVRSFGKISIAEDLQYDQNVVDLSSLNPAALKFDLQWEVRTLLERTSRGCFAHIFFGVGFFSC
jgi:hypothetical protein